MNPCKRPRPLLKTMKLVKTYNERNVVDEVTLTAVSGKVMGILGPNGAGKTTLFYMLAGTVTPDAGRVMLNEMDITGMKLSERARMGISYLPQERSVFRGLTVKQNIEAVLQMQDNGNHENEINTEALLRDLGLEHLQDSYGHELSGGEARRLEIARALATSPVFLLMDEPFAGVDPISVSRLQQTVRELSSGGIGIIISDHSVRETLNVCDTAIIMNLGKIVAQGTPEEIEADSTARKIYLGSEFSL